MDQEVLALLRQLAEVEELERKLHRIEMIVNNIDGNTSNPLPGTILHH